MSDCAGAGEERGGRSPDQTTQIVLGHHDPRLARESARPRLCTDERRVRTRYRVTPRSRWAFESLEKASTGGPDLRARACEIVPEGFCACCFLVQIQKITRTIPG